MERLRTLAIGGVAMLIIGIAEGCLSPTTESESQFLMGRTWQTMSYDTKVAYIWGMGNLAVFEHALMDNSTATQQRSFLPGLVKGLQGKSITEVVSQVDAYFRRHPEQIEHPVIDGLFQAVVLPALLTSRPIEEAK
jgi:hypothetical protein